MASSSSINEAKKIIAEISKQREQKLQQSKLENVKEVPGDATESEGKINSRMGAYGKVIELDFGGTRCVGKVLHPIFFDHGTDPSEMERVLEKFFDEIELLSKMKHPNIVEFLGIFTKPDSLLPVLVMEKMDYSLAEYLNTHEKGSVPRKKVHSILLEISKGLVYLHEEMKIAHRDLSSNNILLTADLNAKIADLGSARVLDRPGGWSPHAKLSKQPGTVDFMPPEALVIPPAYTVSVDVFSFGCVIIHMCTYKWPSPAHVPKNKFVTEITRRQEHIAEMTGSYLLPMVIDCLEESSTKRPASIDIMSTLQAQADEVQLDYTVAFAGMTGTGKSTAGNFFLRKKYFCEANALLPGTEKCSAATTTIHNKQIKIIDTPGFFDGFKPIEKNFEDLSMALTLSKDGMHAIAFVMSTARFTEENERAIYQLLRFKGMQPFIFVLLTHACDNGGTKEATDKYIQQTLSHPRCPPALKNLVEVFKYRVIMLESFNNVEDYHVQKCAELIEMIESMHKTNGYKLYSNIVMMQTAQIYEKSRLQQQVEIRMKKSKLKSNEDRINELNRNKGTAHDTNGKVLKKIDNEIARLTKENEILQKDLDELLSNKYLARLTQEVIVEKMRNSNIRDEHAIEYFEKFVKAGCILGTAVGAITIPILGFKVGGMTGGRLGYKLGRAVHSFKEKDNCKEQ